MPEQHITEKVSEHLDRETEFEPVQRPEPGDVDADPNEPQADPDQAPDDLDPDQAPDPEDDEGLDRAEQASAQGW